MEILKVIGIYILGHCVCTCIPDTGYYEGTYSRIWFILALPSSLLTNEDKMAVRVACSINLGAGLIILYRSVCAIAGITPIDWNHLFSLYGFWMFSAFGFQTFRKDLYLSKQETQRWQKYTLLALAYLGLITSIFCCILFVGYIYRLFL